MHGLPQRLRRCGLAEYGQQDDPPAGCEPVGDPRLLGQQVEPQLADFAAEVAGVGLADGLGLLGEQADEEVFTAEVPGR